MTGTGTSIPPRKPIDTALHVALVVTWGLAVYLWTRALLLALS